MSRDAFDKLFDTDEMTKRERVEATLHHQPVDRVAILEQLCHNPRVLSLYTGPAIYVTIGETDEVMVVNLATRLVELYIPVGDLPSDLALSPDESTLYVTNTTSGTVSVISTASNTVVDTIPVGAAPAAVDFDSTGTEAYVANSGEPTVSVIDVASGMETQKVTVAAAPGELELRRPQGSEIAGYAVGRLKSDIEPYDCELVSLHVHFSRQRRGIGRQLVAAMARALERRGCRSLMLWVLEENRARWFYERLGGQLLDQTKPSGAGPLEVAYGWSDIGRLRREGSLP